MERDAPRPGDRVIFAPDLAAKITLGEKTVTRRPVKRDSGGLVLGCTYHQGRSYAVQLARGGFAVDQIRILSVTRETTDWPISWTEARAEGFASPADFEDRWLALYGQDGSRDVWRIEFALVKDAA